jgi:hypothetical protein
MIGALLIGNPARLNGYRQARVCKVADQPQSADPSLAIQIRPPEEAVQSPSKVPPMAKLRVLDLVVSPRGSNTGLHTDAEVDSSREIPVPESRELAAYGPIAKLADERRHLDRVCLGQYGQGLPSKMKVGRIVRGRIIEPVIDRLKNGLVKWRAGFPEETKRVEERKRVRRGEALQEGWLGMFPDERRAHHLRKVWFRYNLLRQEVSTVQFGCGVGKNPITHSVMSERKPLVIGWAREPDQLALVRNTAKQAQGLVPQSRPAAKLVPAGFDLAVRKHLSRKCAKRLTIVCGRVLLCRCGDPRKRSLDKLADDLVWIWCFVLVMECDEERIVTERARGRLSGQRAQFAAVQSRPCQDSVTPFAFGETTGRDNQWLDALPGLISQGYEYLWP